MEMILTFSFFFFGKKKQLYHGMQNSSLLMSDFVCLFFDALISLVPLSGCWNLPSPGSHYAVVIDSICTVSQC